MFDWTHIRASVMVTYQSHSAMIKQIYHFSLTSMTWGPDETYEILDGTRTSIKHVSKVCNSIPSNDGVTYPEDVCSRSRSLYLAGLFTLIFMLLSWILNLYLMFGTYRL